MDNLLRNPTKTQAESTPTPYVYVVFRFSNFKAFLEAF